MILKLKNNGIVYSSNKYRETEGSKDLSGDITSWNDAKRAEEADRVKHV